MATESEMSWIQRCVQVMKLFDSEKTLAPDHQQLEWYRTLMRDMKFELILKPYDAHMPRKTMSPFV